MKLFLVRHGETVRNRDGRVQGQVEHSLTELGIAQARAAAKALASENITVLCTSPLRRAIETGAILGLQFGLQPTIVSALAELDTGALDGLTSQEMRQRFPHFMALWDRDPGTALLPGGESLEQVQQRVWRWVEEEAAREHADDQVVAVSHNFAISTLVCKALDAPIATFRRFRVDLGSISAFEITPERTRVVLLNSTFHLNGLQVL